MELRKYPDKVITSIIHLFICGEKTTGMLLPIHPAGTSVISSVISVQILVWVSMTIFFYMGKYILKHK